MSEDDWVGGIVFTAMSSAVAGGVAATCYSHGYVIAACVVATCYSSCFAIFCVGISVGRVIYDWLDARLEGQARIRKAEVNNRIEELTLRHKLQHDKNRLEGQQIRKALIEVQKSD